MRQEKGVVATEAVLSFALLLVTLLSLWSAVRLVYEKTSLETATQLSAQGGVTYFIRNTPISCGENNFTARCDAGRSGAEALVTSIFESNICDNDRSLGSELSDGASFDDCSTTPPNIFITCRQVGAGQPVGFTKEKCELNAEEKKSVEALIIRFTVEGSADVDGGVLSQVVGSEFNSTAEAYGWRRINEGAINEIS